MGWMVRFVAYCWAGTLGLLGLVWAATGFRELGVQGHALIAMILGIVFTTGLASVLMALVFHSSRSRKDDEF